MVFSGPGAPAERAAAPPPPPRTPRQRPPPRTREAMVGVAPAPDEVGELIADVAGDDEVVPVAARLDALGQAAQPLPDGGAHALGQLALRRGARAARPRRDPRRRDHARDLAGGH